MKCLPLIVLAILLTACGTSSESNPTATTVPIPTPITINVSGGGGEPSEVFGVMLDAGESISGAWSSLIPVRWQTPADMEPQFLLEVETSYTEIETCAYIEADGMYETMPESFADALAEQRTLIRRKLDITLTITDLVTDSLIVSETFSGELPDPCPDTMTFTFETETITGEPDEAAMISWVRDNLEDRTQWPPDLPIMEGRGFDDVIYSPDGSLIAAQTIKSPDSSGKVIPYGDAATGEVLNVLRTQNLTTNIQFSADGSHLLVATYDGTVNLWNLEQEEWVPGVQDTSARYLKYASLSPDSSKIVTVPELSIANVWRVATQEQIVSLEGHTDTVLSARFSPDGTTIVTASRDNTARTWSVATGVEELTLPHPDTVQYAEFSPDGTQILTVGRDDVVRLWNSTSGELEQSLPINLSVIFHARFDPSGKWIMVAGNSPELQVWHATRGYLHLRVAVPAGESLRGADLEPSGQFLVTASQERLRVWDVADYLRDASPMD